MIKKYLSVLTVALVLFSFGIASAAQIDGLNNAAGPVLPIVSVGGVDPLHVYVNPGGLGDVLFYGYYNVRDNKVDYFQIVNTDDTNAVPVKVRFREAATIADACGVGFDCGSFEVLDFIICLSPGDVWTGAITGFGSGPARLWSLDTDTTTIPTVPALGQPFSIWITLTMSISEDQTKEGYFEVLGYGINPPSCADTIMTTGDAPNVLMGTNYIIDEDTGSTFAYKATALADFNDIAKALSLANEDYNITNGQDGNALQSLTAVDYVLTKANLMGTYVIDPLLGAETEIIVTLPTKLHNQLAPTPLFNNPRVAYSIWNTEEDMVTPTAGFSPSFVPTRQLPNEVNVINLYNGANSATTTIFTSDVQGNLEARDAAGDFNLGWINIDLTLGASTPANCLASGFISCTRYGDIFALGGDLVDTAGLPAIGYAVQELADGIISATFPLSYDVLITDN